MFQVGGLAPVYFVLFSYLRYGRVEIELTPVTYFRLNKNKSHMLNKKKEISLSRKPLLEGRETCPKGPF